jgi:hypothetical protein
MKTRVTLFIGAHLMALTAIFVLVLFGGGYNNEHPQKAEHEIMRTAVF